MAVSAVKRWASGALAGAALSVAAVAAAEGDAEQGRALADAWCASCHQVAPGGTATDAAPAFPTIANDPGMTQQRLRGWLVAPHPPMPDFHLTRAEIDAIIAYLETLRRQ
jgi:mono/diheme cytochrome c family protein